MLEQKYFYTVEPKKKCVSKEEFNEFLKNYPRKLEKDVCGICDPPSVTYNDFELANRWPYSVIANTWLYSDNPEDYWYVPEEERNYYIIENYMDVFDSKTGNKA